MTEETRVSTMYGESRRPALWYALITAAIVALALAGYSGYALYPRFDLPSVSGVGLLVLAAAAGIAAFFSPCSFPLLVTLLARESASGDGERSVARALGYGAALALGATLFLTVVGIVIALGGRSLFAGITFTSTAGVTLRAVIGSLLIILGIIQFDVTPISFRWADRVALPFVRQQARTRREHPMLGFGIFGFAYLLAGFG